jgi:hypothetical protein
VAEDEPDADEQVHMAKAWISEATHRVVAHGQKIHGGIGFTKDYKIQLYFRRQKAGEFAWSDSDPHRELVAQSMGTKQRSADSNKGGPFAPPFHLLCASPEGRAYWKRTLAMRRSKRALLALHSLSGASARNT